MKYGPSSYGFNKLVIKAQMHPNTYLFSNFFYENTIKFLYVFEKLSRMHENKMFFIVFYFKKTFLQYFRENWVF